VGTLEHDNMTFTGLCHTPGHGLGISPAATEYDDFDLAVALATLKPDEADDEPGAPAIEIGLDMTSPRREGSGLPPPGAIPEAVLKSTFSSQDRPARAPLRTRKQTA
jgi:hypothetical protein